MTRLLTAALAAIAGCTALPVSLGGNDDRVPCGPTLCDPGLYCCNESCGICAPPGTGCIELACGGGDCDPQRVAAATCIAPTVLGFAWNGATCTLLSGCACEGEDCMGLYGTLEACEADRAGCTRVARSCVSAADCAPGELCDFMDGDCGVMGTLGVCRIAADVCPPVLVPACGCDGREYASPCDAELGMVDVAFMGPCDPMRFACGETGLTCGRHVELCVRAMGTELCEPYPADCPAAPCECAPSLGMCFDDGAGGVTVER